MPTGKPTPEKVEAIRIRYSADHAERLLATDFAAYLEWYSPRGRFAREVKRPDS